MEKDRAETNLGDYPNDEPTTSKEFKLKQPKKRFVGRKTAEKSENVEKANGGLNGTIEDSGAIQGIQQYFVVAGALC